MNRLELSIAFVTLADVGSVQRAAEVLHQTNAAVSRKITKLENYLGVKLIKRERSGSVLTDIGQRYYHQCKQAMEAFELAEQLVEDCADDPKGSLTVVANQFYTKHFLMPKLQAFMQRYPKIKIHIDILEILPNFKRKQIDIMFGVGLDGADNLVRRKIDRWRHIICASPAYFKKQSIPNKPAELLQHKFIVHSSRKESNVIFLNEQTPIVISPVLHMNQSDCIIEAALNHLGMIWIPEPFVEKYIAAGKLIEVLAQQNRNKIDVYLYYQYQKLVDSKIRAFIDFFVE